jgi:hypothetical protein
VTSNSRSLSDNLRFLALRALNNRLLDLQKIYKSHCVGKTSLVVSIGLFRAGKSYNQFVVRKLKHTVLVFLDRLS